MSIIKELDPTLYGMRSVTEGGVIFCGVRETEFAIDGVTHQWPRGSKFKWSMNFSQLGQLNDMMLKDVFTAALKEPVAVCDVGFEYISDFSRANLQITKQTLDGPNGVLADCQVPMKGMTVDSSFLRMRIDESDRWSVSETLQQGFIDLYRTFLHEALHFLGLGHKPANVNGKALISPMYDLSIRSLQELDISELVRRYLGPKTVPAPLPPPPGGKPINVTVEQDGKVWGGLLPRIG